MLQSTVTGNRSGSFGGGIASTSVRAARTSRSTISGNAASASGGGIGVNAPTADQR